MTTTAPVPTSAAPRVAGSALFALLLVAVNLRLAITTAAALLPALTEAGVIPAVAAVLVPAIPTAVFAVAGFGSARLAAKVGTERAVLWGLVALTLGLVVRMVPEGAVVVVGTVVATGGLAVVNVLLPAIVRAHFSGAVRPVTTAYTTMMSLGAAGGAAAAVPLAGLLGSLPLGLGVWALPALAASVVWLLVMRGRTAPDAVSAGDSPDPALELAQAATSIDAARRLPRGTKRLAAYFALQSLTSYVTMGWLPSIAADAGIDHARAGGLLAIAALVGVPGSALFVALVRSRRLVTVGFTAVAVATVVGYGGLLLAPAAAPELWAVMLGVSMCAFPMLLAILAGIGRDAGESARVSALAQSVAYSVATVGPLGAGALREASGSWTGVILAMVVLAAVQAAMGFALVRATHPATER